MKNMNHRIAVAAVACLVSLGALSAFALDMRDDYNVSGVMNFDTPLKIKNVTVTNTAANLNKAGDGDITAQSDTNSTTTTTLYTPRRVGDILMGYAGGTATMWAASAATTNGWIATFAAQPNALSITGASTLNTLSTTGAVTTRALVSANTITATGLVSVTTLKMLPAETAAPTNAATRGFIININGTNFWVAASVPNGS